MKIRIIRWFKQLFCSHNKVKTYRDYQDRYHIEECTLCDKIFYDDI